MRRFAWGVGAAALCVAVGSGSCSASSSSDSNNTGGGSAATGGVGGTGGIELDGSGGSAAGPPTGARYEGKVWGPHHDGQVPFFPVPGALVAAFTSPPPAMTQGAQCRECVQLPEGTPYTTSAADGSFSLDLPVGQTLYLVVQKGEFRRVRQLNTEATVGVYPLDPDFSSLPRLNDDALGDHVPKMALVYGDYDHIEDVLAKTGFAKQDTAYGVDWASGQITFDVYDNSGPGEPKHGAPLNDLIQNPAKLGEYDVVLFSCSYNANFAFMQDVNVQNNLKNFVWGGGKLYVSDYAMPVVEMPWPSFVWFTDPLHGGCAENQFPPNCNHGPPFDSPATAKDVPLGDWLEAQNLLGSLETKENWNTIGGIAAGEVGQDPNGQPLIQEPKVWVEGPWSYSKEDLEGVGEDPATWDLASHPMTLSFPYNCGRVLYTTYHTVGTTLGGKHPDLMPQEMILFYLLMEITVCPEIPIVK